jgi:hypothetical protein
MILILIKKQISIKKKYFKGVNKMKEAIFWTKKDGTKIDIDDMDIEHLRNTLKMVVRNIQLANDLTEADMLWDIEFWKL